LLLEMVTAERFAAAALLLDLGERTATLATPTGSTTVSLGELAPLWSGDFRFLWDAPAGFDGLLREGDSGPAVAEVAARFARLDGQERSLSDNLYNAALATRVRLFQRAEGLTEDGIVGAQTLQRLNVAAGLVPGAAARRERWDQLLAAGFQP
jgi:general secretion pathway protein A